MTEPEKIESDIRQCFLFVLFLLVLAALCLMSWLVTGGEMGPNLPPSYTR